MDKPVVLVTGASGFVAKHCIAELLRQGYRVRGTLRRLARADEVKSIIARTGVDPHGVTFFPADLTSDEGWDVAVRDAQFILHTASPFPIEQPTNRDDVIVPARDGALRVLKAAVRHGVKRTVMTSSTVAVMYGSDLPEGHLYTELDWTDVNRADLTPYIVSKTVAERAAWDFIAASGSGAELAVINPSFVQGPALDPDLSTSLEVIRLIGTGSYPAAPRVTFPLCDVRDVALAHVAAMENPLAAGQRFIIASGHTQLIQLGQLMVRELPDLAGKVPKFTLPDFVVRGLALVDKRLATVLPELGHVRHCSADKARTVLGIKTRSVDEAVRSAARSLRELKLI